MECQNGTDVLVVSAWLKAAAENGLPVQLPPMQTRTVPAAIHMHAAV